MPTRLHPSGPGKHAEQNERDNSASYESRSDAKELSQQTDKQRARHVTELLERLSGADTRWFKSSRPDYLTLAPAMLCIVGAWPFYYLRRELIVLAGLNPISTECDGTRPGLKRSLRFSRFAAVLRRVSPQRQHRP
jgi:hypothetical protein